MRGFQHVDEVIAVPEDVFRGGNFPIAVFNEWARRDVGRILVRIFDDALGVTMGQRSSLYLFAESCGDALALEHNGDSYSYDHFVEPDSDPGNLGDIPLVKTVGSPQHPSSVHAARYAPAGLPRIPVCYFCNRGRAKARLLPMPASKPGLSFQTRLQLQTHRIGGWRERSTHLLLHQQVDFAPEPVNLVRINGSMQPSSVSTA